MKDWSDLEEKYQGMREKDAGAAEDFKKQMTERFQKTVQALEEESQAEKRQLQAMHQQRVISQINQKKKLSMSCSTERASFPVIGLLVAPTTWLQPE